MVNRMHLAQKRTHTLTLTQTHTHIGRNGHSHLTVLVVLGLKMIRSVICNKNKEMEKENMGETG